MGDASTQAKVGQTLGRPLVVRLSGGGYSVLVTSGYNNTTDGKGRLWMLNPSTGAVIWEFTTADGSLGAESGLAHVSPFVEADGSVRYVYGGDLLGNVWKFDLVTKPAAPTKVAARSAASRLRSVPTARPNRDASASSTAPVPQPTSMARPPWSTSARAASWSTSARFAPNHQCSRSIAAISSNFSGAITVAAWSPGAR